MMHTRAANLGTETAFSVLARAAELSAQGRDVINLGIGQPDFPTPPHIVEAGIKALRDGHHGYTPSKGIASLREAVAESLHQSYHAEINPDHVQILPGGKVVMFFATQLLGEAGVEIIYPDPGFPIYASSIRFSGATPVPIPYQKTKALLLMLMIFCQRLPIKHA
jgi:aspartate/methionine/tyrosine aminotransferase